MSWPEGISWTKGYDAVTINPDESKEEMHVHSGPFLWLTKKLSDKYKLEFYLGFRPTPTWSAGIGNEGIFPKLAQLLKKIKWGNFGFACRIKKAI